MLTDLDSRNIGRDRLKFAANLRWSIHLQIVHILMRGPSGEIDHNDRFVFVGVAFPCALRVLLRLQQLRQREAAKSE